jgi:predicted AlkP superfamily pyrophosphatase or phosphodiesterase
VHQLRKILICAILLALAFSAAESQPRPIVILVSIDGWRWDYLSRFNPPALTALASRGVVSEGLIPSFPSKTFPNHYTIVTGLYPGRHGIVSNNMRDPAIPGLFSLRNRDVQQDSRWWVGVPLWVTSEQQGHIAGTMFWPGSDAEIAGDRPTWWRMYDHNLSNAARVDQILTWLRLPEATKPTFLTLYFSDVDTAGHDFGPESQQIAPAIERVDAAMARLVKGIEAAGLAARTNLVVLSDHGMAQLSPSRVIVLDDYIDVASVDVIDWSPVLTAWPLRGSIEALYRALKDKHPALAVYRKDELPAKYRLAGHPRVPPVVGIADDGWEITSRRAVARDFGSRGNHGYDPAFQSMHGLFIATGPAFREGLNAPRFESVHVYELLCGVLGIRPAANDGDRAVTAGFFRQTAADVTSPSPAGFAVPGAASEALHPTKAAAAPAGR